jgi:hypothetical protein
MKGVALALALGALAGLPVTPRGPAPVPAADRVDCARCHNENGWRDVQFDHEKTRMPLRDRHADIACRSCHQDVHKLALEPSCATCHVDVHAGRLGRSCERCHDQRTFASGAGVEAHGQTRFPLIGRHAMVACEQCHQSRTDRTFGGARVECATCHSPDAQRTLGGQVDHTSLGEAPDCRPCHTPVAWRPAQLPTHERCFPITGRPHGGIACRDCHTALRGVAVQDCNTYTASCTRCHHCGDMDKDHREENVAGYACMDRKCFECHPGGVKD